MRKPEKEPKTEKAGASVPSGRSGKEGDSGEKKPGRGRKPRAKKQEGETGAAVETGEVREAGTVTESETASEKAGETVTEPETVAEAGNETPAEQETAPGTAEMPAAETGSGNDTVGESAAEDENAREEAAGESGEEPGPAPGSTDENMSAPVSATAASAQIVESPLKLMKQEFQRRYSLFLFLFFCLLLVLSGFCLFIVIILLQAFHVALGYPGVIFPLPFGGKPGVYLVASPAHLTDGVALTESPQPFLEAVPVRPAHDFQYLVTVWLPCYHQLAVRQVITVTVVHPCSKDKKQKAVGCGELQMGGIFPIASVFSPGSGSLFPGRGFILSQGLLFGHPCFGVQFDEVRLA